MLPFAHLWQVSYSETDVGDRVLKKVVLIIPYFGKKPDYYSLWEMSAKANSTVDFLILTDVREIKEDRNIHVKYMQFSELRERIQKEFDFKLSLNSAYKFCDFRPAYGYIFAEEVKEYDFWGHCDMDLIFGDIRSFLTEDILEQNDKIFEHGHFCLYRNNERMVNLFREDGPYPEVNYKEAFTTNDSFAFDEFPGMVCKCHRLGIKTYLNTNCFFDCKTDELEFKDAFHPTRECKTIIRYEQGKLFAEELAQQDFENEDFSRVKNREIMYFHFQKRKLDNLADVFSKNGLFWIIPNELVFGEEEYSKLFAKKGHNLYQIMYNINRYKKKITDHKKRFETRKKEDKSYSVREYVEERKLCNKRFRDNRLYREELFRKERR